MKQGNSFRVNKKFAIVVNKPTILSFLQTRAILAKSNVTVALA